jgi:peptidoglycan hydrolase CwlO-like protein
MFVKTYNQIGEEIGKILLSKKNFAILVIIFFIFSFNTFAQETDFNPVQFCPNFIKDIDKECEKLGQQDCQQVLEKCEKYYQGQSNEYQAELSKIQQKEKTLESEIGKLTNKIKVLNNEINENNLINKDLGFQIGDTEKSIKKMSVELERIQEKLGVLLQLQYEQDHKSFLEILLAEANLSSFFDDLAALESINHETQKLLGNVRNLKSSLTGQKELMVSEKQELEEQQILIKLQKEQEQEFKNEKNDLLNRTRGKESLYQKYLAESKSKAQEIRKKIFELAQISETEALNLEQAYDLAKEVGKITGIRPAFLLGLLKLESDIGKNVGQCNCKGRTSCRYPEIQWRQIMTQKNWPYFEQITSELGMDINMAPVSCAVNGGKVQWGGAMGPAQFMPETWVRYNYKSRVENILGVQPANPWRIKDAFMSAALYLFDFGASSQKEANEIRAARAYLCGTTELTRTCQIAGGADYTYKIMKQASIIQGYVDQGVFN